MSNMSQVQNILLFQGCDKIVLRLYTAGTESPDTPKHIRVPPISMNIIQIPPDNHQTSSRHPPDISREQEMPTDDNRRQQTLPDVLKQHLSVSFGVWSCLFVSVVVCWHLLIPGYVWWVSDGCLGDVWWSSGGVWVKFMEIWGTQMCLGVSGLSVPAVTLFCHNPQTKEYFAPETYWTSKYQNLPI